MTASITWETVLDSEDQPLGIVMNQAIEGMYLGYRTIPICPGVNWDVHGYQFRTLDFSLPDQSSMSSPSRADVMEWVTSNPIYD